MGVVEVIDNVRVELGVDRALGYWLYRELPSEWRTMMEVHLLWALKIELIRYFRRREIPIILDRHCQEVEATFAVVNGRVCYYIVYY